MMRKLLLASLFILQLSILPSWGAETVLIDRLTTSEAEELNIEIPAETPPGYHEVIIEVSDNFGVVEQKILTFCKGLDGTIDWASDCPGLAEISSAEELRNITSREDLPEYDPAQEPEKSKDLQVAAFAVLAALSAGGAAAALEPVAGLELLPPLVTVERLADPEAEHHAAALAVRQGGLHLGQLHSRRGRIRRVRLRHRPCSLLSSLMHIQPRPKKIE